MTLTTDQPTIVDAPAPPPTRTTPRPHRRRGAVTWVVALAGLGAAATLTVAAVMTDDGPTTVDISRAVIERGSVSAIDHRDQETLRRRAPGQTVDISRAVIEHGSVSAIDHRDQAG